MTHFQVIPAAYLLLTRGDGPDREVLLQLRGPATSYMAGHWASGAAGHVEYGESVRAAAVREAAEELGVTVDPADLVPLCALQRSQPGNPDPVEQRVDYFLELRRWDGEPSRREPEKATELGWFGLSDLPTPMVAHEEHVLTLLRRGTLRAIESFGFDDVV